LNFPDPRSS